jgi:hypothetical protein
VLALAAGGQRAQLALLQGQYAVARGHVLGCMAQLLVSPTLRPLAPHVHTLAGLYCHGVGQYAAAEGHFGAAQALHEGAGTTGVDASAAAAAAALRACALLAHDAPDAVSRAIEALGGLNDAAGASSAQPHPQHAHAGAGRQARCALQLVSGLVRLRLAASATSAEAGAEQARAAKLALSKALKVAHQAVRHHQLVTSVMLAMVPVQLRPGAGGGTAAVTGGAGGSSAAGGNGNSDVAGAAQMLGSADLLARNNGDGATRTAVKRAMLDVLAAQGADEGNLASARADADARAAKLARAREGAAAADPRAHAAVLAWGLA